MSNTTETGRIVEGPFENDRNTLHGACFKAAIREVYGVTDVIIAHHLVYVVEEKHKDGFAYQVVEEIPAADTLIFDHDAARKLWGETHFMDVLRQLACEPVTTRDKLFSDLYYARVVEADPGHRGDLNHFLTKPVEGA